VQILTSKLNPLTVNLLFNTILGMKRNTEKLLNNFIYSTFLCGVIQLLAPPAEGNLLPIWIGWTIGLLFGWLITETLERNLNE